ncbi:MEDS domain-containing protein [Actinomadura sp. SCN-SB]|uniref:MEDS domain-containing protein n=1 Tax=Actinomadura sp. SCN-SB TaxID=3373092 RepID=UPI00375255A3
METNWFAKRPVKDVRPGDHAWLAYSGAEERDLVIGGFVGEGLDTGEKIVYVTEAGPETLPGIATRTGAELRTFLGSRQLRVIGHRDACLDGHGRFVPEKMAETIDRESGEAFGQGFRAVRITTDHSWLLRGPGRHDLGQMVGCEHRMGDAVAPSTMAMAICQIERRACLPDELAALRDTHEVLVEVDPEFSDEVLTIVRTFDPPGLRVEGELDSARHTVFADTLARASAGRRVVLLDVSRLAFIDLGGLHLLTLHANGPAGVRIVLDGLTPAVEAVIDMVGWHRLPGIVRGRRPAASTERFGGGIS